MFRLIIQLLAFAFFSISVYARPSQKIKIKISLEEAIEIAKDQSPSALVAKHNFLASYWQFRAFKAQLLPSLNDNTAWESLFTARLEKYEDEQIEIKKKKRATSSHRNRKK